MREGGREGGRERGRDEGGMREGENKGGSRRIKGWVTDRVGGIWETKGEVAYTNVSVRNSPLPIPRVTRPSCRGGTSPTRAHPAAEYA